MEDLHPRKLLRSFITAFFMFGWVVGLILGCSKTVASHAHVLYSSTGVYIIVFSLITCKIVHRFEILGYMIFVIGLFITLSDPLAQKQGDNSQHALGNIIAFVGTGFGAIGSILSQKNAQDYHFMVLITQLFFFIAILQLLIFPLFHENALFFSFDSEMGAFGWMADPSTFIYLVSFVVPITSVLANIGFFK
jgi:hypothetical protein